MTWSSIPLQPDAGEARRLLLDELSKPAYQAAKPTFFDLAAQAFLDWFTGLFISRGSSAPPLLLLVALLAVVAAFVAAIVLFGPPSRNRRSASTGALFGEDDRRSADDLRRAARAALASGDLSLALLERFRALARGLDERTLVAVSPGTTATGFARSAAEAFPDEGPALSTAASAFDAVRYAGAGARREQAEQVAALDDRLASARPSRPQPVDA